MSLRGEIVLDVVHVIAVAMSGIEKPLVLIERPLYGDW
jgi:hypothetical protein